THVSGWFDDLEIRKVNNTNEIIEESNYYPFGLKHKGYNGNISSIGNSLAQKWGYNGKEYQDDNIGGNNLNWHDFGARNYDAALGRWMNLDPLAEKMRRHSPYNYAFNNPIYFIDPDGMAPIGPGNGWNPISGIGEGIARAFTSASNRVSRFLGLDKMTPVLEGSVKVTAGLNVKAKANVYGVVKADVKVNAITFEIASGKADFTDATNPDSYTGEHAFNGDGKGVKYSQGIGVVADVAGKKIAGGDISHSGRVHSEGPATDKKVDGGVYLINPIAETESRENPSNTMQAMSDTGQSRSPSSSAKTGTKSGTFYGVDLGAGAALVLGLDINLKIGVNYEE
ncbi:RHS repeat domain-containing protein, partial [Tenacibaculum maritimum]|uniref:RHS repeat domain-containing protein n=1 Tax=Tenacibaculum maritimum TaxID=107401 RepID=UPI001914E1EF